MSFELFNTITAYGDQIELTINNHPDLILNNLKQFDNNWAKYNPKKNIGVEARIENFLEATNRVLEKEMEKNIVLENKFIENMDFSDATLIYYSVKPNLNHILHLMKMIQKDCRIITPKIPLPSIKPKKNIKINNSAFFLTEGPLEKSRANNIEEWIKTIPEYKNIGKMESNKNNVQWLEDLLFQIYSN